MLQPRKQKHRREFRNRSEWKGTDLRGSRVTFGKYGLKATTPGEITSRQIEAARRVLTRYIKRGGRIWINIFPHKPITRKASEVPMGSGKGAPEFFVCQVRPGRVLFEMDGITAKDAKTAMLLSAYKLPVKCRFINTTEK